MSISQSKVILFGLIYVRTFLYHEKFIEYNKETHVLTVFFLSIEYINTNWKYKCNEYGLQFFFNPMDQYVFLLLLLLLLLFPLTFSIILIFFFIRWNLGGYPRYTNPCSFHIFCIHCTILIQ